MQQILWKGWSRNAAVAGGRARWAKYRASHGGGASTPSGGATTPPRPNMPNLMQGPGQSRPEMPNLMQGPGAAPQEGTLIGDAQRRPDMPNLMQGPPTPQPEMPNLMQGQGNPRQPRQRQPDPWPNLMQGPTPPPNPGGAPRPGPDGIQSDSFRDAVESDDPFGAAFNAGFLPNAEPVDMNASRLDALTARLLPGNLKPEPNVNPNDDGLSLPPAGLPGAAKPEGTLIGDAQRRPDMPNLMQGPGPARPEMPNLMQGPGQQRLNLMNPLQGPPEQQPGAPPPDLQGTLVGDAQRRPDMPNLLQGPRPDPGAAKPGNVVQPEGLRNRLQPGTARTAFNPGLQAAVDFNGGAMNAMAGPQIGGVTGAMGGNPDPVQPPGAGEAKPGPPPELPQNVGDAQIRPEMIMARLMQMLGKKSWSHAAAVAGGLARWKKKKPAQAGGDDAAPDAPPPMPGPGGRRAGGGGGGGADVADDGLADNGLAEPEQGEMAPFDGEGQDEPPIDPRLPNIQDGIFLAQQQIAQNQARDANFEDPRMANIRDGIQLAREQQLGRDLGAGLADRMNPDAPPDLNEAGQLNDQERWRQARLQQRRDQANARAARNAKVPAQDNRQPPMGPDQEAPQLGPDGAVLQGNVNAQPWPEAPGPAPQKIPRPVPQQGQPQPGQPGQPGQPAQAQRPQLPGRSSPMTVQAQMQRDYQRAALQAMQTVLGTQGRSQLQSQNNANRVLQMQMQNIINQMKPRTQPRPMPIVGGSANQTAAVPRR